MEQEEIVNQISKLKNELKGCVFNKFSQDEELAEIIKNAENYENYDSLDASGCQEIMYNYDISKILKKYDDIEKSYMQDFLDDYHAFFNSNTECIESFDAECAIIYTYNNQVVTADLVSHNYVGLDHAFLIIEQQREASGCFGGIYICNEYGCEVFKQNDFCSAIAMYSKSDKIGKIDKILSYYNNDSKYISLDKSIEDFFICGELLFDSKLTMKGNEITITYEVDFEIDGYTDQYLKDLKRLGVLFSNINDETARIIIKQVITF